MDKDTQQEDGDAKQQDGEDKQPQKRDPLNRRNPPHVIGGDTPGDRPNRVITRGRW